MTGAGWTEFPACQWLHSWPLWALGNLCQLAGRLQALLGERDDGLVDGLVDVGYPPVISSNQTWRAGKSTIYG